MSSALSLSPARYQAVTSQKAGGVTYTPPALADFVAAQMLRVADLSARELHVLDPAVGGGELLHSLLKAVANRSQNIVVHGYDIDAAAIETARRRLAARFPNVTLRFTVGDFLDVAAGHKTLESRGSLFSTAVTESAQLFDLVIANPPYVRTQIMGAKQAQKLAAAFGLSGRVDLYHAFLLAIAGALKPSGTAGVIVSNRFMTTKGGAGLRAELRSRFDLRHVWDLGDTKLFDAAVLPAVIVAQGSHGQRLDAPAFTSIYQTAEAATLKANDAIEALSMKGTVALGCGRNFQVQHGTLDASGADDDLWRIATDEADVWLATVEAHTWRTFGDVGKVRVGVKTCADKIFIRSDWHERPQAERPELLRALTTHHNARRFRAQSAKKKRDILYPHAFTDGKRCAVDLALYPRSLAYLEEHRAALESRSYLMEGGRQWYELWVPQNPAAWDAPKLVFRDISERPTFWIDEDRTVVNGDCYWMMCENGCSQEHLWLAVAVANSTFIEAFYDHRFNNKLYSGRRRFMTQYVEKFPLPAPTTELAREIIALTKVIYAKREEAGTDALEVELDALIWRAFGLEVEEIAGQRDL